MFNTIKYSENLCDEQLTLMSAEQELGPLGTLNNVLHSCTQGMKHQIFMESSLHLYYFKRFFHEDTFLPLQPYNLV